MIDQTGGAVRSGARGEFSGLTPARLATGELVVCVRGHRLDLDLYGKLKPYSHRYRLHGTLCEVCRAQEGCEPSASRLTEWAHLDVTVQHAPGTVPSNGLAPVAYPPTAGTLAGRIELHLDGTEGSAVTASPCASCRTATLDYVHVAADYRRLGFGLTLVVAAVARARSYKWTAPLPDGPVAQSFLAGSPCAGPVSDVSTPVQLTSRSEHQRSKRESVGEEVLQQVRELGRQELVAASRERGC